MSDQNSQELENQPEQKKSRNIGCMLGWIGLLVGFSPIILAFLLVYTTCGGNSSESSCGAVGAVFLLPFTLIAGFVLGVIGIFKYLATPNSNE
jgi:hypothetical protein